MTLLLLLVIALVLVLTWALQRDWHVHDWDRRRVLTWGRDGYWPSIHGILVQAMGSRCRTCGDYSVKMIGPGWTLMGWGNR